MAKNLNPDGDGRFEQRLERPKRPARTPRQTSAKKDSIPHVADAMDEVMADIPTKEGPDWPLAPGLNPQQQLFCEYYLGESNFNATDAARRAGYKQPTVAGYRLTRNIHILARVRERMANAQMDADEVMARLTNVGRLDIEHCLEYVTNSKGEVLEVKANRSEILRALEIIAKRHGLLRDKLQVGFEGMTPAELRAFLLERMAAKGVASVAELLKAGGDS